MNAGSFRRFAGWGAAVLALGLFSCDQRDTTTSPTDSASGGIALVGRFQANATVPKVDRVKVVLTSRSKGSSVLDTVYSSGLVLKLGSVAHGDSFTVALTGFDSLSQTALPRWWTSFSGKADGDSATQTVVLGTIDSVATAASSAATSLSAGATLDLTPTKTDTFWYTEDGSDPRLYGTAATGKIKIGVGETVRAASLQLADSATGRPALWSGVKSWIFKMDTIPWNATITYGTFTDLRDDQVYSTVKIGTQTWLARNLNYRTDSSWCASDSCGRYGRLYKWAGAMDTGSKYNDTLLSSVLPHQGVCPAGWHLPSIPDWDTLFIAVGGIDHAVHVLKATVSWPDAGSDSVGFRAIEDGYLDTYDSYVANEATYFWTSTEHDATGARYVGIYNGNKNAIETWDSKDYGYNVRCVLGSGVATTTPTTDSSYYSNTYTAAIPWNASSSITYGSFVDSRDSKLYKTVAIGTQKWMAQNLDYATDSSWCYAGNSDSCTKYGRLYQWAAAMDTSARYDTSRLSAKLPQQGLCPSGWHLPSEAEWSTLIQHVDSASSGTALKSTSGWDAPGSDSYGFRLLPAGYRMNSTSPYSNAGHVGGAGSSAYFWSSEFGPAYANDRYFNSNAYASGGDMDKTYGFSLRCTAD